MSFEIGLLLLLLAGIISSISHTIHKLLVSHGWSASQLSLGLVLVEISVSFPFFIWGGSFYALKTAWIIAIISAGIFSLSRMATFKAFETLPLSVVIIFQRLSLVVTAILANFFLNESSNHFRWLGLVTIVISSIILGLATHHENKQKNLANTAAIGLFWALIAVITSGSASVLDKVALKSFSSISYLWISSFLVGCHIWFMTILKYKKLPDLKPILKREFWWLILAGCTNLLAYGILLWLMKLWDVSLTMPVYKISSLIITVFAGWFWLKERDQIWSKTIALFLGCLGIWLMSK